VVLGQWRPLQHHTASTPGHSALCRTCLELFVPISTYHLPFSPKQLQSHIDSPHSITVFCDSITCDFHAATSGGHFSSSSYSINQQHWDNGSLPFLENHIPVLPGHSVSFLSPPNLASLLRCKYSQLIWLSLPPLQSLFWWPSSYFVNNNVQIHISSTNYLPQWETCVTKVHLRMSLG
jgi:hypothetical protein